MKVAIIGSGLAAVSVAKELVAQGLKPVILDHGETLDKKRVDIIEKLSKLPRDKWGQEDRYYITSNPTVHDKNSFPQKLAFSSNFFYGKSCNSAPVENDGTIPPFSYAKGGFSVGWGASVLPADDCDLSTWPIGHRDLQNYYKKVLTDLPLSATKDSLSEIFPVFSDQNTPLKLTAGNRQLLERFAKIKTAFSEKSIAFGQSRLLVQTEDVKGQSGCQYCGFCLSGCVYGCIYKSNQDIDKLCDEGAIEYIAGALVHSIKEVNDKVQVYYEDHQGQTTSLVFDRVFLAAGAVNSTRIIMQSLKLYEKEVILKSTSGFIAPMWRLKRTALGWPDSNTLPGLFLEYKADELSEHWIHTQLSTPNELVLEMLGIGLSRGNIIQQVKGWAMEHMVIAHCNMHSDHGNGYILKLVNDGAGNPDKLVSRREQKTEPYLAVKKALKELSVIGRKLGCYTMTPFVKDGVNSGGYHVGGSMPMKADPQQPLETDLLGRPNGWKKVHVVDSSVFPSLPGTTIGLLAMANATRIADEVLKTSQAE